MLPTSYKESLSNVNQSVGLGQTLKSIFELYCFTFALIVYAFISLSLSRPLMCFPFLLCVFEWWGSHGVCRRLIVVLTSENLCAPRVYY